jgi:hypothetical protein
MFDAMDSSLIRVGKRRCREVNITELLALAAEAKRDVIHSYVCCY